MVMWYIGQCSSPGCSCEPVTLFLVDFQKSPGGEICGPGALDDAVSVFLKVPGLDLCNSLEWFFACCISEDEL